MSDRLSTTIVIFGASGDLSGRKLIPAFYNLYCKGRLPDKFNIVGVSRTNYSHDAFRRRMENSAREFADDIYQDRSWRSFSEHIWYVSTDAADPGAFQKLDTFLKETEPEQINRLYYLAVAPSLYLPIVENLGKNNMADENHGWRHVIIEKPFGYDLDSARALNNKIHETFAEYQVYRIDHYLGKETAQNILFLRFANTIFEPVWNRNYIDNVQITVAETVDVGERADYYDQSGVLRDMFQNHLLQLLMLIAMEPPTSFDAEILRNEKVKVLTAVRPVAIENTVRGQYEGYRDLEDVPDESQTETYAALKLCIDNWRWQNVPFYLRSGKALARKTSEINIEFKCPPHLLFNNLNSDQELNPNRLSICIQPDEGIHLTFEAKVPDSARLLRSVDMEFHYRTSFEDQKIPEAYERLLLDAIQGDAALFTRSDEIEAAWQIIDPILKGWRTREAPPITIYPRSSWGPEESDAFLARDQRKWRLGCLH